MSISKNQVGNDFFNTICLQTKKKHGFQLTFFVQSIRLSNKSNKLPVSCTLRGPLKSELRFIQTNFGASEL